MSLHIDSEDVSTGTRYSGTWNLSKKISGAYSIVSQTMQVQDIPWVWTSTNIMQITIGDFEYIFNPIAPADLDTISVSTEKSSLATYFQTRFNILGEPVDEDPGFSTTWVYNSNQDRFEVTFNAEVTINWSESTCRGWFHKQIDNETATVFYLNCMYITQVPKFLYISIEEAVSRYATTKGFSPNIIFSTFDNELAGQEIVFRKNTYTLTMNVYLVNVTYDPVPLSDGWEIILNKA